MKTFNIDVGIFGHGNFELYVKSKAKEFDLTLNIKSESHLFTMNYTVKVDGDSENIEKFDKSLNIWRM